MFLYFRSTSNYDDLYETAIDPEVDYDHPENIIVRDDNVHEGIDHSSNIYLPFGCANSDSDTDSEISCSSHVRSSNSSDSSCTYYNP